MICPQIGAVFGPLGETVLPPVGQIEYSAS